MFYVIHCKGYNPEWIWIKKKREAVLAAEMLSRHFDNVELHSSDGAGMHQNVFFGDTFQLSLFDVDFDEVFEKYVYSDGFSEFYAYRVKK